MTSLTMRQADRQLVSMGSLVTIVSINAHTERLDM